MSLSLSRERLVELLERGRRTRILVVGDAMLDVYLAGDVDRISPEAPVPVVRVRERRHALGGAANVAQNVAAVGASCHLVAAIGRDAAGDVLSRMLASIGAGDTLLQVERCTTQKSRILARSQQLVRIDEEDDDPLGDGEIDRLLSLIRAAVATADAVVLEDYNKGVLVPAVIRATIDAAAERTLPIVVDPKYRNFFSFSGATIFKPIRRELESAVGATIDLDHPAALPELLERLGARHLLLTLGVRGMLLASADGTLERIKAVAREVYDVVGAGDTVTAYLATMLAAGATPAEAAVIANVAAGIEVGKLGAASVSRDELLDYVDAHALHV
jgi:D-beta-D-heptose 7-phosphate kinase/D-beta-D-heptose 1-phosphate adenosyltransferase